jgi:chemotaxis protein MotB
MKDLDDRELDDAMKQVRGTWRPWLLLVLTIGIAGYGGWHLQQKSAAADKIVAEIDTRIAEKVAQIAVLEGTKKEYEQRITKVERENQALLALKQRDEAAAKEKAAALARLGKLKDQIAAKPIALARSEVREGLELVVEDKTLFDGVEPVVSAKGAELLAALGTVLTATTGIELEIGAHSDEIPTAWESTAARAGAIAKSMAQLRFDPTKIRAVGYGASVPVATNKTGAGRAQNRRIVFTVQVSKPRSTSSSSE